jgi:hypothetical protein
MHNHDPSDTQMSRLIRIETKLSNFINVTQQHLNILEGKIDHVQQTLDEVYPPEEETTTP